MASHVSQQTREHVYARFHRQPGYAAYVCAHSVLVLSRNLPGTQQEPAVPRPGPHAERDRDRQVPVPVPVVMVRFMRHDSWQNALIVSWPIDPISLAEHLPDGLVPDLHGGQAWVSIVALTESGIYPYPVGLPLWLARRIRLSHHAVNVRTYVRPKNGGTPGIYFFSLDCSAMLPTVGARALFGLPYRYAAMWRSNDQSLTSDRYGAAASLRASWHAAENVSTPQDAALASFLIERYTLYNPPSLLLQLIHCIQGGRKKARYWRGTVTHEPWAVCHAKLDTWHCTCLEATGLADSVTGPPRMHCTHGVGPIEFFFDGLF